MAELSRNAQRDERPDKQRLLIPEDRNGAPGRVRSLRRKAATAALAVLSAALCLYAVIGHDGIVAYLQKRHHLKHLQSQVLDLQQQNAQLSKHNERLKSDPDLIEFEAREQMHLAKPGEVIYTLPEAPGSGKSK